MNWEGGEIVDMGGVLPDGDGGEEGVEVGQVDVGAGGSVVRSSTS